MCGAVVTSETPPEITREEVERIARRAAKDGLTKLDVLRIEGKIKTV